MCGQAGIQTGASQASRMLYAGSDRLQRWQASSKIRRQADRRKASKWELSAVRDRL